MKKILCLLLVFLLLSGCGNSKIKLNEDGVKLIDTKTVYNEIDNKNVYIIDVREDYEYKSGHIKNSYNLPLTKIEYIGKMLLSLDSKIIVYCRSGSRSKKAAELLMEMGYTNVYDMGGIDNWNYELIKE